MLEDVSVHGILEDPYTCIVNAQPIVHWYSYKGGDGQYRRRWRQLSWQNSSKRSMSEDLYRQCCLPKSNWKLDLLWPICMNLTADIVKNPGSREQRGLIQGTLFTSIVTRLHQSPVEMGRELYYSTTLHVFPHHLYDPLERIIIIPTNWTLLFWIKICSVSTATEGMLNGMSCHGHVHDRTTKHSVHKM